MAPVAVAVEYPWRPRGFDELRYYAEHFDIVEVNSTFYRMPDPGPVAKWAARTPADFQFAVKLFQKFTHPDMYLARAGVAMPVSIGTSIVSPVKMFR